MSAYLLPLWYIQLSINTHILPLAMVNDPVNEMFHILHGEEVAAVHHNACQDLQHLPSAIDRQHGQGNAIHFYFICCGL